MAARATLLACVACCALAAAAELPTHGGGEERAADAAGSTRATRVLRLVHAQLSTELVRHAISAVRARPPPAAAASCGTVACTVALTRRPRRRC